MIKELTDRDLGRWIYYEGGAGERENGRIKSFNNETRIAFVVYNANGNWDADHWKDYTAQSTKYDDLVWPEWAKT